MNEGQPVVLTALEVARQLGTHVHTVKRIPPTELPYFTIGSRGDRRYRARDVVAYIENRTVQL